MVEMKRLQMDDLIVLCNMFELQIESSYQVGNAIIAHVKTLLGKSDVMRIEMRHDSFRCGGEDAKKLQELGVPVSYTGNGAVNYKIDI